MFRCLGVFMSGRENNPMCYDYVLFRLIVSVARLRVSIKSSCLLLKSALPGTTCRMRSIRDCTSSHSDADVAARCETARRVIRAPLREGGFGLTAVSDTSLPAFYHPAAHSIRSIYRNPTLLSILEWDKQFASLHCCNTFGF